MFAVINLTHMPKRGDLGKIHAYISAFRYAIVSQYSFYRNFMVVVFGSGFPVLFHPAALGGTGTEGVEKSR